MMKRSHIFFVGTMHEKVRHVPRQIKILLAALFVYTIAWGILEPFLPIYFESITGNYTGVGILFALINVMLFFTSIPVGALADRIKPTRIVSMALAIYPFIGAAYAFAASAVVLSFTRIVNGLGAAMVWVSSEAFLRKKSPPKQTAGIFGLYSSIVFGAVTLGSIIAAFIVAFVRINELFLVLVPLPIIAIFMVSRINHEAKRQKGIGEEVVEIIETDGIYRKEIMDFERLGFAGIALGVFVLFNSTIMNLIYVFIPLKAHSMQLGLPDIAMLYAWIHVPLLFSFFLSGFADKFGKNRILAMGLVGAAATLGLIFVFEANIAMFIALCLVLAFFIALLTPAINGLITDITPRSEAGEISGIYYSINVLGGIIAPIAFGVVSDAFGLKVPFIISAVIAVFLAGFSFAFGAKISARNRNPA